MLINKLKLNKNKPFSLAILSVAVLGLAITTTTLAGLTNEKEAPKPVAPIKPIKPITPPKHIKLVSEEGIEIELLKQVAPYYPRKAATKRIEGFVNLEVSVNANGQVGNIIVIESIPKGIFDKEAIRSVEKYEFAPMSQAVKLYQKIEFKLEKSTEAGYGVIE